MKNIYRYYIRFALNCMIVTAAVNFMQLQASEFLNEDEPILSSASTLAQQEQVVLATQAHSLFGNHRESISLSCFYMIIDTLKTLDKNDIVPFLKFIKPLYCLCRFKNNPKPVLAALAKVTSQDRAEFTPLVQLLIRPDMSEYEITRSIQTLARLAAQDRAEFVEFVKPRILNLTGEDRIDAIEGLAQIAPKDRADVNKMVKTMMRSNMMESNIRALIKYSMQMDTQGKANFVKSIQSLMHVNMSEYEMADVIALLSDIPQAEHPHCIARALLWARGADPADYYFYIYCALETNLEDCVDLEGMDAIVQNAANPYAIGIDVHTGARDERTVKALKVLIEQGEGLSKEMLKQSWDDFWQAVVHLTDGIDQADAENLSRKKQNAIFRVLGIDDDGNSMQRSASDFGGLLTNAGGTVTLSHGSTKIPILPKELLARFWHFANSYVSEHNENPDIEHANLRQAVLNGIANGLQDDTATKNHVVCDPGKIQRLVVTTLQGRLRDADNQLVDIDGLGLNAPRATSVGEPGTEENPVPVNPLGVTNLREIAQYLQPWINRIAQTGMMPQTAADFFDSLFQYLQALKDAEVIGYLGEHVHLNASEVVHYITMMEPILKNQPLRLNPEESLYIPLVNESVAFF